ncbi:MAG: hypothetical protein K2X00_11200 [Nitrospiraceae bacterium]|nr:hypothetical protein [Nitrospiraceae bacterium]
MAKERRSLTSLSDRLARKASPEETLSAPVAATAVSSGKGDDRVQVMVRMSAEERKALRRIALDHDTTAQALVEDAIRDVLRRHGH